MLPTEKPCASTVIVEGLVMLERKLAGTSALSGVPSDHFKSSDHVPPPVAVHCAVICGLIATHGSLSPPLMTRLRAVNRFMPRMPGMKPTPSRGSGTFNTSTGTWVQLIGPPLVVTRRLSI